MLLASQQSSLMVPSFDALKQRVSRFVTPPEKYKEFGAKSFIKDVEELGEAAIFGGLLRDLSLDSSRTFTSDIDLVVETDDDRGLASKMEKYGAIKNSFGGFRLQFHKWKIDIWPLRKTWAIKEGLVKEESFEGLLKTTFFDWDAVVFNLTKSKILSIDNYLEKLTERVVDINLKENPNNIGIIVRALRLLEKRNAKFTWDLSEHVFNGIESYGLSRILEDELDSYNYNILSESFIASVHMDLRKYLENFDEIPFSHQYKSQLCLFD